jgi:hypothetical protein
MSIKSIIQSAILAIINALYATLDYLDIERPMPPKKKHHLQACREKKNDVWLTPEIVAKDHIETVACIAKGIKVSRWIDPYRNTGNYYNNFKSVEKDWAEILQGKDMKECDYKDAVVCSNPPYSCLNEHFDYQCQQGAAVISALVLTNHITTPRLERMRQNGYHLVGMKFYNVKGYMNTAVAITWTNNEYVARYGVDLDYEYMKGGFKAEGEPIREKQ